MSDRLFTLRINTRGLGSSAEEVQRLRGGLANRAPLHAQIAVQAEDFTRAYLRGLNRHRTATALNATPTGHHARAARGVESASNANAAILRIPRSSGLGRAFRDVTIRPGSGKKFLTIPADKRTYGKRAGEFAPQDLAFTIVGGRYPALMFRDGWTVAYWLRREVKQTKDRTLLPSDKAYREIARNETAIYMDQLLATEGGPA
jgi:hypothetical protein